MNAPHLNALVRRAGRSLYWAEVSALSLRGVVLAVAAVAGALLIDVGYALPCWGLVLLDVALLGVWWWAFMPTAARWWRGRCGDRGTAMTIERQLDIANNAIINALDLAGQSTVGTSEALRSEAIRLGESAALSVAEQSVIDRGALRSALKPAAGAMIVMLLAYALMPGVFHSVLPRLASPLGDHPPFTRVRFDIRTEPELIHVGKSGTIRVSLSGPVVPERAQIVFVEDGMHSTPLPMVQTPGEADAMGASDASRQFALRLDRVNTDRRFFITTLQGRSEVHTLKVDTSPLIERVEAAYAYPDYTHWRDLTAPVGSAGIRALVGTRITLGVESNVPLSGGTLRVTFEDDADRHALIVPVSPVTLDPRQGSVRFTVECSGRLELTLLGADGVPSADSLKMELQALPDRPPKIEINEPDLLAVAPEGWRVETQLVAGDDIGLGPVVMHQGLNDQPTTPTSLAPIEINKLQTIARGVHTIDLAALGAKAGDVVRYYASVADNHPDPSQLVQTPVHAIHVITMQQYLDLARSRYRIEDMQSEFEAILDQLGELQSQRASLLAELADFKAQLDTGKPLTEAQQAELTELQAVLEAYARQAETLSEAMQTRASRTRLYDVDELYQQMLDALGAQFEAHSEQAKDLASALKSLRLDGAEAHRDAARLSIEAMLAQSERMGNALQQMVSAWNMSRNIPGIGAQGGSGAGMSETYASMAMVGPPIPGLPGSADSARRGRIEGREGPGRSWLRKAGSDVEAEWIHAETSGHPSATAGRLPGVPAEYREQAEAYFRRLAEEDRGD